MKKSENTEYKFVQYIDGFSGDWGLGFSLMDKEEEYGWEYNPISKRLCTRDSDYILSDNVQDDNVIFTYGF